MPVEPAVEFHPVEIDLLCTFAEVDPPFPLRIPSVGTSAAERSFVFRGAREELTRRGLADEQGPLGIASDFVHLLRSGTGALDLVLMAKRIFFGAVVLAERDSALLVVQEPGGVADGVDDDGDEDGDGIVRMRTLSLDDAVYELLRKVPKVDAANTTPFTLPHKALREAYGELAQRPREDADVDEFLRARGIDESVTRRMAQSLQPALGNGQAGTARRGGAEGDWHRTGEELRWLDTPRGRYRLAGDDDWISVNPLARNDLLAVLRKLASSLRG